MIYLDYAASAPMSEQAIDAYAKAARNVYGNSQSLHDEGGRASEWLAASRKKIASLLGGFEEGLYFTGSGSEANVLALQSLLNGADPAKKEIVYGGTEHTSIRTYIKQLSARGYTVKKALPGKNGVIGWNEIQPFVTAQTALISVQHANSETGILHNIKEISGHAYEKQILFHSDCVQTFGKIPILAEKWKLSALSLSAHKVQGPKGMGAAYISPGVSWRPAIEGTAHEHGFRPGTVDVPGAVSFAVAAMESFKDMDKEQDKMREYRKHLVSFIEEKKIGEIIEAPNEKNQLPGIIGCLLSHNEGQFAMLACSQNGIAISTGSACHSGMTMPSPALLSLGVPEDKAHCFIRVSTGKGTVLSHIEQLEVMLERCAESAGRVKHN
ncbi:aminotransferase class V-fold PLP-dependent enzyme [Bacillus sp. FJAT-42376]|uniref:IscS subfamily cysteine desulfurase n=1 Tax=Bacillus sp. FJAT-42376 TaxID=2014076 RepID=UPI000F4DD835|nr:IscS subfamily cysteine desulfurase [Bacillus sp. FJAT-42376]AZB43778.1 aminotransferase class V-fold PLP-dependent enzyme [Bacillus sp. FJAT-42376]